MIDFHFADPQYAFLLLALPVLGFLLGRIDQGARTRLLKFMAEANLIQLLQNRATLRERGKRFAFWAGLVCLTLALCRPQANPSVEELRSAGLDIYVLFDVSRSMDAEDVPPSRLKKAKRTLQHLASRLSGDRIGIIAFANSSVLISPLTSDYSIIDSYLQNIDTTIVPSQGTNLGHALETAKEAMDRGAKTPGSDNQRSNIFLVLSDGEDHGESDLSIVDTIHKSGGLVFTIAFGTEKGAPIPMRDDKGELRGYKKDSAGNVVVTAVQTGVLQDVAKRGGGQFYFSTSDEGEVEDLLARVSDAQRGSIASIKTTVWQEYFWLFLAPGLALLLFSFVPFRSLLWPIITNWVSRKRAASAAALLFATCLLSPSPARAGPFSFFWSKERKASEQAEELAKQKKYGDAVDSLKGLQAENPDTPELNYNIGTYLLQDQKGRIGREQLGRLRNADGPIRDFALFNTAGSLAMEGKKPEARAAYAELLQHLASKKKLSAEELNLLESAKRNVARLADPSQQPPPQQDKSDQQKQGGGGGNSDQKKDKQDNKSSQGDKKGQDKKGQDKKDEDKKGDEKKQQDNKQGEGDKDKDKKDENKKPEDKDQGKENKQGQEQGQDGKQPPRQGNQPFKERDEMGEDDAKRILGALKERESDLQKKFLRNKVKGGKVNVDDAAKDW